MGRAFCAFLAVLFVFGPGCVETSTKPSQQTHFKPSNASQRRAQPHFHASDDGNAFCPLPGEQEAPKASPEFPVEGLDVGSAAPDLALALLQADGSTSETTLSELRRGECVVLFFGSLTCRLFRENVLKMVDFQGRFSDRTRVCVVYVREAHPGSTVTIRNPTGELALGEVPRDETEERRIANAIVFQRTYNLQVPIAVDGPSNSIASAYGAWPNRIVVVGNDGRVRWRGDPDPEKFNVDFVRNWAVNNLRSN